MLMIGTPVQLMRTMISVSKSMRLPDVLARQTAHVAASGYTRKPHIESLISNDSVLIHTQTCVR